MKVLITGANGFMGLNLQLRLRERRDVQMVCYTRDNHAGQLAGLLQGVDFVFHLAGVNRPLDPREFVSGNVAFTRVLCKAVADTARQTSKPIPILYTSSTQAAKINSAMRAGLSCLITSNNSNKTWAKSWSWCAPTWSSCKCACPTGWLLRCTSTPTFTC